MDFVSTGFYYPGERSPFGPKFLSSTLGKIKLSFKWLYTFNIQTLLFIDLNIPFKWS